MNCLQCKRRAVAPGNRYCVTCAAVFKARYLEHQLNLTRADLEQAKASPRVTVVVGTKPPTRLELDDANIRRCRWCDTRFIPDTGHSCRLNQKRKRTS